MHTPLCGVMREPGQQPNALMQPHTRQSHTMVQRSRRHLSPTGKDQPNLDGYGSRWRRQINCQWRWLRRMTSNLVVKISEERKAMHTWRSATCLQCVGDGCCTLPAPDASSNAKNGRGTQRFLKDCLDTNTLTYSNGMDITTNVDEGWLIRPMLPSCQQKTVQIPSTSKVYSQYTAGIGMRRVDCLILSGNI